MKQKPLKIVYLTPALYMAGGVERVLTLKANYFAEHFGYDITIILTEGKDKPLFYPLSDKVKVVNLNIGFEELWTCSFVKKVFVYLKKQRLYKKLVEAELMHLRPDITISLLRREINFITGIKDGSKKIGELHVNRANYRNFESGDSNFFKTIFAKFWMRNLVSKLKKLDKFVVLTHEDKQSWPELSNLSVIPDPLSFVPTCVSSLTEKRVIAVGRYVYQKGFDLLLQAWSEIEKQYPHSLQTFEQHFPTFGNLFDSKTLHIFHANLTHRTSKGFISHQPLKSTSQRLYITIFNQESILTILNNIFRTTRTGERHYR